MKRDLLFAACMAVLLVLPAFAKKPPPVPTQDPITYSCVLISDIYVHGTGGGWINWKANGIGLDARVTNNCKDLVTLAITIAYWDSDGEQFASSVEVLSLAPMSWTKMYNRPADKGIDWQRIRAIRIVYVR